jgi:hypothetical protein
MNSWVKPFQTIIIMFLVSRVMLLVVGYFAAGSFDSTSDNIESVHYGLDVWAQWDGGWYLSIAREGYYYRGMQEVSSIAFFPLYPLLIKSVAPLTGNSMVLAGLLVSYLCLLVACFFLYDLARHETGDEDAAQRAVLYLLIAPASLFFSAVYTESLFLLLSVAAFWATRQQRWGWAIFAAALATATRAVGVLLWCVVLWELIQRWWEFASESRQKSRLAWVFAPPSRFYLLIAACTCLIPLVLMSFIVFSAVQFGDPNAFGKAQVAWGRTGFFSPNIVYEIQMLLRTDWSHTPPNVPSMINLIALVAGAVMIIPVCRRWGATYGGYALMSWLIPVLSSPIGSQSLLRYITVVFPFFMVLGVWGKSRRVDVCIIMVFALMLGLLTTIFVTGRFAG